MPSSKLREVTGANSHDSMSSKRSVNIFTDNPVMSGPRTSRPKRRMVEIDTSDEDDLGDEEDEVDDDEAPVDDDEDVDDVDMDDAPPQPPVSRRNAKATRTANAKGAKSVEAKEMEQHEDDEDDDEELSELLSDGEGEPADQDESLLPDETSNINVGEGELEGDELDMDDIDSDDPNAVGESGKMTKRQRGALGNDFLQLPMGEFTRHNDQHTS